MATEKTILSDTAPAGADLSTKQWTLVKFDGSGNLIASTAGANGFVLEDNPTLGLSGTIALVGITKCKAGATVAKGDLLMSDGNGAVITATTGSHIVGQALDAGVVNDIISLVTAKGTA